MLFFPLSTSCPSRTRTCTARLPLLERVSRDFSRPLDLNSVRRLPLWTADARSRLAIGSGCGSASCAVWAARAGGSGEAVFAGRGQKQNPAAASERAATTQRFLG